MTLVCHSGQINTLVLTPLALDHQIDSSLPALQPSRCLPNCCILRPSGNMRILSKIQSTNRSRHSTSASAVADQACCPSGVVDGRIFGRSITKGKVQEPDCCSPVVPIPAATLLVLPKHHRKRNLPCSNQGLVLPATSSLRRKSSCFIKSHQRHCQLIIA